MNKPLSPMYSHVLAALERNDEPSACACDIAPLQQSERYHLLWRAARNAQWEFVRQKIDDGFVDDNTMLSIFWNAAQYQQHDICKYLIDRLTQFDESLLRGCCKAGHAELLAHLLARRPIQDNGLLGLLIADAAGPGPGHDQCLRLLLDHVSPDHLAHLPSIPVAAMRAAHLGHEKCFLMLWPLIADQHMVAVTVVVDALNEKSVKVMELLLPHMSWEDLARTNVVRHVVLHNHEEMSHFMYDACPDTLRPAISENIQNAIDPEVWEQSHWASLDRARQTRSTLIDALQHQAPPARPSKM